MAGGGGGGSEIVGLEYTPTWMVALVCSVIVLISFFFERGLHWFGKCLKRKDKKPLFEALQKVKEELMLLGFISLLLVVFQNGIQKICIRESVTHHLRPCKKEGTSAAAAHYVGGVFGGARRLLAGGGGDSDYCKKKGKEPLLSVDAIHELHIFIFVLAFTHVVFSLITVVLGRAKIRQWRHWEEAIQKENASKRTASNSPQGISHIQQFEFIQDRFQGFGKGSFILAWLLSFFKQFYGSVSKSDYTTMRFGFIMTHCRGNLNFNFFKYMIRALDADFKKVVGISWYLWIFSMAFFLINVNGWHAYFWLSLVPMVLLLACGTKLEHIITQLAHEVAEKHSAIEGDLIVTPSDDLFWFNRPRIVLVLIHFILFQNAFEIAYFFWILMDYGYHSCMMGKSSFLIPRLVISVISQLLCSYSTLPLYAIVTQMGSTFKKAIFEEHVQEGLIGWAQKIRRKGRKMANGQNMPDMVIEMEEQAAEDHRTLTSSSPNPLLHVPHRG